MGTVTTGLGSEDGWAVNQHRDPKHPLGVAQLPFTASSLSKGTEEKMCHPSLRQIWLYSENVWQKTGFKKLPSVMFRNMQESGYLTLNPRHHVGIHTLGPRDVKATANLEKTSTRVQFYPMLNNLKQYFVLKQNMYYTENITSAWNFVNNTFRGNFKLAEKHSTPSMGMHTQEWFRMGEGAEQGAGLNNGGGGKHAPESFIKGKMYTVLFTLQLQHASHTVVLHLPEAAAH